MKRIAFASLVMASCLGGVALAEDNLPAQPAPLASSGIDFDSEDFFTIERGDELNSSTNDTDRHRPRPRPGRRRYVYIYGGRESAYDTAYCPRGFQLQSCSFNYNSCDNTEQGWNYCRADSRNHRPCNFRGLCVEERRRW